MFEKLEAIPDTFENELKFVAEITLEALKADKFKEVGNLVDKLFGLVREHLKTREPKQAVIATIPKPEVSIPGLFDHEITRRPNRLDEMPELVAPWPTTAESAPHDCDYDSIAALSVLPEAKALPEKFGETKYSAIRLNPQTVALSVEHYGDFQAAVAECLNLREKVVGLEAAIVEASRRHVAVETLAEDGFTAYQTDGVEQEYGFFVESLRCDSPDCIKESLTDALEDVARQVRSGSDWYTTEATQPSKPDETAQPAKKFNVGQLWADYEGHQYILERVDGSGLFPISGKMAIGSAVGIGRYWTAEGKAISGQTTHQDLKELIQEVWPEKDNQRFQLLQEANQIDITGSVPVAVVAVPEPGPLVAATDEPAVDEDMEMPF